MQTSYQAIAQIADRMHARVSEAVHLPCSGDGPRSDGTQQQHLATRRDASHGAPPLTPSASASSDGLT